MALAAAAKTKLILCSTALLIGGGALVLANYAPIDRLLESERRTQPPEVQAQFTNPTPVEIKKKSGCGQAGGKCCCAAVGKACGCSSKSAAPEVSNHVAVMTTVAVGLSTPGGQGMLTGPAAIAAAPKLHPVSE